MGANKQSGGLLQEKAYRLLRQAICEGKLTPGSELSENELAARFRLTKAPLRSALSRLSHEGWLTAEARRGYVVRPITLRDTQDIFALRKMLEPPATRMAAGRIDSGTLRTLDSACRNPYGTCEDESHRRFFSANKAFHVGIAQVSGNARLATTVAALHDECERILRFGMEHLDWSRDWRHGHEEIIDALVRGDGDEAERLALRQLETSEKIVLDALLRGFSDIPVVPLRISSEDEAAGQEGTLAALHAAGSWTSRT